MHTILYMYMYTYMHESSVVGKWTYMYMCMRNMYMYSYYACVYVHVHVHVSLVYRPYVENCEYHQKNSVFQLLRGPHAQLIGFYMVNAIVYNPQTVKRFYQTLTDMPAKSGVQLIRVDTHLMSILFACWTSLQESTNDSPFLLPVHNYINSCYFTVCTAASPVSCSIEK